MSRATRGARVRRGTLLTLLAMTAVVTAGLVTVLGFGEVLLSSAADGETPVSISRWLSLPLLVIGAVAVPAVGHELALARREEVGLARLRGMHGRRLVTFLLAEPFVAIVLGGIVGLVLGLAGTWLTTRFWLEEAGVAISAWTSGAAVVVVLVATAGVALGMAAASREPLSDQVSIATRAKPATAAALFGSVVVLAAAGIAVYRAGRETDPDLVVLAGPALVGLAAGQLTVWLLRGVARVATARTTGSALPAFLATRRVGRGADRGTALRLLVAAGAVGTLAATGAAGISGWTDDNARLTAGAPTRVDLDELNAREAVTLTEELDPNGRWLTAAVYVDDDNPLRRRAFVDTERYVGIIGDFYSGTPADDVVAGAEGLAIDSPDPLVGDTVEVVADGIPYRLDNASAVFGGDAPPLDGAVEVTIDYVATDGTPGTSILVLRARADGGTVSAGEPLENCADGCVVRQASVETGIVFQGDFFVVGDTRFNEASGSRSTQLRTLRFGDTDLTQVPWRVVEIDSLRKDERGSVQPDEGGGLLVRTAIDGTVRADLGGVDRTLPLLVTAGLDFGETGPVVLGPGGDDNAAEVVSTLPGLPFVEGSGMLADLPSVLYGSGPTIPGADVMVLAADDTPASVIARLREAGGTVRTLEEIETADRLATGAVTARVYAVLAGCCLSVALLAFIASAARQRAAYRTDVAALRVVGVPPGQIRSAGVGELALLAGIAVVAGTGAGLIASRLLLDALPLATVPEFGVPLQAASSVLPAIGTGLLLALVVVVVAGRGRRLDLDRTRPAILRDEQPPVVGHRGRVAAR
ncbi:ABC transporter permease [Nocardioides bigeumensis]|uniref:ABC3 transporter permease C-terminal domain-containing protein n=1 Tax=Nocardioides bigeumensis TaxID=433657 RepID=A0ABP5KTX7_9ACTN